eukprot:XP_003243717.2 PREDICTED: uncharacterized protein LOC100571642 [Acyrthosiphon pisum]
MYPERTASDMEIIELENQILKLKFSDRRTPHYMVSNQNRNLTHSSSPRIARIQLGHSLIHIEIKATGDIFMDIRRVAKELKFKKRVATVKRLRNTAPNLLQTC